VAADKTMAPPGTTAYPYLRFSSDRQAKGDSRRRQSKWHEEEANRYGWVLDRTSFKLKDEGRSAFTGENVKHDLGEFLAAVNGGSVKRGSVLLFEEMDRLTRQHLRAAFPLVVGILTAGIHIHTASKHYTEDSLDDLGETVGLVVSLH
jgi:DNA invertase Pin-like site-specific DNA recombinase